MTRVGFANSGARVAHIVADGALKSLCGIPEDRLYFVANRQDFDREVQCRRCRRAKPERKRA